MKLGFILLTCVLLIFSCGGGFNRIENNDLVVKNEKPDSSLGGVAVKVINHLEQHKPDLSVEICATKPSNPDSEKPTEKTEEKRLCFGSTTFVKYNGSIIYYLSPKLTKKLLAKSPDNKISVQFNDSYSNSSIHWYCNRHPDIVIDKNTAKTQYVDVTVTQSNVLSYSCIVTKPTF